MNEWNLLQLLEQTILNLDKSNISQSLKAITDVFDYRYSYSFNIILLKIINMIIDIKQNNIDICLDFIKYINTFEEGIQSKFKILDVFAQYLNKSNSSETNYLIVNMIEQNMIGTNIIKNKKNLYFMQYMTNDEINELKNPRNREIFKNINSLKKNDYELHKQLIKEGHNPNEIAKVIRNDEIEKLQEISSQPNFDFNQKIEPSLYERCSFINNWDITLIDYAAFFSSIKCFKYLLMNGAKLENTGKYAIASGNEEIIHLCEQNHSTFEDAYETAIQFHRNNIFKYIYENKISEINNLEELGKKCILFHNYEIFLFLQGKGMKINDSVINVAARVGNLYLIQLFLKENQISKDILVHSSGSGNIELVEYILELKKIDINFKNRLGWTALIIASFKGNSEIVKLLLEQEGIDINATDEDGKTALMYASLNGHAKIVKLLLKQKEIDINAEDKGGKTALMYVSEYGHIDIIKYLLENEKIDINAKDGEGWTALMIASLKGNTEIVKILINHEGIDINVKDKYGQTALLYASDNHNNEIAELLKQKEGITENI